MLGWDGEAYGGCWGRGLHAGAGAGVMATGIVSVGLQLIGYEVLSLIGLAVCWLWWVLLALAFTFRLLRERARWIAEARTPPALTAVAASTLLGTRLSVLGWQSTAAALLALAVLVWPGLLVSVMLRLTHRMPGGVFLICVPAPGIAVLAGRLSVADGAGWLSSAALAFVCLGLVLYVVALTRFDVRQIFTGAGDQWVAGGALAISALAGSTLIGSTRWTGDAHQGLRAASLLLLALAFATWVPLVYAEIRRPRLSYDVRRWSTIFPLGMTAVASLSLSTSAGVDWLEPLGRVLLWVAVGAWLLTFSGLVKTLVRALQGE
nr:tellurite resistance/C4-dicarboxylate transporter family protein [Streptomyces sp. DvalAA-14]